MQLSFKHVLIADHVQMSCDSGKVWQEKGWKGIHEERQSGAEDRTRTLDSVLNSNPGSVLNQGCAIGQVVFLPGDGFFTC